MLDSLKSWLKCSFFIGVFLVRIIETVKTKTPTPIMIAAINPIVFEENAAFSAFEFSPF